MQDSELLLYLHYPSSLYKLLTHLAKFAPGNIIFRNEVDGMQHRAALVVDQTTATGKSHLGNTIQHANMLNGC